MVAGRPLSLLAPLALAALAAAAACAPGAPPGPRRFLAITHPALNRVTFFDLDRGEVAGVLPAHKLPHDLLLADRGRSLIVVNSGAQCVTRYRLDQPALWREARAFMRRDTARAARGAGAMFGGAPAGAPHPPRPLPDSAAAAPPPSPARRVAPPGGGRAAPIVLHADPVHLLPSAVAEVRRTDRVLPPAARAAHAAAGAEDQPSCFACHERALGTRPFAIGHAAGGDSIVVVQMHGRSLAVLEAASLELIRTVPLDLPAGLTPIEAWLRPGTREVFVTCREEIGTSRRGIVAVADLATGARLATIPAGIYPWHLVPDAAGARLYVNNFQSSRISVVDVARRSVVDSLTAQNGPAFMAFSPDRRLLYVSCFYTGKVLALDPASGRVEREVAVGSNPTSLLVAPDRATLLVLCGGESALEEIDLRTFTVRRRHPLLFGAYAFLLVDRRRPAT